MKMKQEHFDYIKAQIEKHGYLTPENIHRYETGDFFNSDKVKDLNKRFAWDVFYRSDLTSFTTELYEYLNDDHIYTALKNIVPRIQRWY